MIQCIQTTKVPRGFGRAAAGTHLTRNTAGLIKQKRRRRGNCLNCFSLVKLYWSTNEEQSSTRRSQFSFYIWRSSRPPLEEAPEDFESLRMEVSGCGRLPPPPGENCLNWGWLNKIFVTVWIARHKRSMWARRQETLRASSGGRRSWGAPSGGWSPRGAPSDSRSWN